ncbi:cellulose biosynthesis protein BcsD [Candidatus Symbiobacter mobilis]|uniref:Cellulose synthase subunit D n=1 Tax=Candidatus Symbiobacter mobilis CR TaxID=946483 RepID=U5N8E3_9BURK|nr:hypothetical protein [Candidatus Symbiobacter mobilis]AGX87672.1 hypothetical protein Cenrod_1587 [Candidatus Symbiobacter mobilis CR]
MSSDALQTYFRSQQVSLQWLPVLRALAIELAASADAEGLRQLFFKVGERFANDAGDRFEQAQTLAELEEAVNEFWLQLHWGWVQLSEARGTIDIEHQAAPLAEAFGEEHLGWSVGLLEGFYQALFASLGAGASMRVQAVTEACGDMTVTLRFGQLS